jgi:hypothetical protein
LSGTVPSEPATIALPFFTLDKRLEHDLPTVWSWSFITSTNQNTTTLSFSLVYQSSFCPLLWVNTLSSTTLPHWESNPHLEELFCPSPPSCIDCALHFSCDCLPAACLLTTIDTRPPNAEGHATSLHSKTHTVPCFTKTKLQKELFDKVEHRFI